VAMVNPSLDELLGKVDNRFALVIGAAKRARQIIQQETGLAGGGGLSADGKLDSIEQAGVSNKTKKGYSKPVTRALEDITAGRIVCIPSVSSLK
jgi:DNA-directed RNA polymerase omega subunit